MSRVRFLGGLLAVLVIIGLLVLGGLAIHRIGWSEGYKVGQLVAGNEEAATVPYAAWGSGYSGLFITIGLLFLLLIVIGKFFRFWAWKAACGPWAAGGPWMMAHGPKGEHWPRHWHRHHGPMPPWCWGEEEPSEEKAKKAESGAETDEA